MLLSSTPYQTGWSLCASASVPSAAAAATTSWWVAGQWWVDGQWRWMGSAGRGRLFRSSSCNRLPALCCFGVSPCSSSCMRCARSSFQLAPLTWRADFGAWRGVCRSRPGAARFLPRPTVAVGAAHAGLDRAHQAVHPGQLWGHRAGRFMVLPSCCILLAWHRCPDGAALPPPPLLRLSPRKRWTRRTTRWTCSWRWC